MKECPIAADAIKQLEAFAKLEKKLDDSGEPWVKVTEDEIERQVAELDELWTKKNNEEQKLEAAFSASMTEEQKRLFKSFDEMENRRDCYDEEEIERARAEYKSTFTEAQREMAAQIKALNAEHMDIFALKSNLEAGLAIKTDIPSEWGKAHADAVCEILNAALVLSGVNPDDVQFQTDKWNTSEKPESIGLIISPASGISYLPDWQSLIEAVKQHIQPSLQNSDLWKKTFAKRGDGLVAGYVMMTADPNAQNPIGRAVSAYAYGLLSDSPGSVHYLNEMSNGRLVSIHQADLLGQKQTGRQATLILEPAADKLFAAFGVDKNNIQAMRSTGPSRG